MDEVSINTQLSTINHQPPRHINLGCVGPAKHTQYWLPALGFVGGFASAVVGCVQMKAPASSPALMTPH